MTHVTCRLTAENRDWLWNPTLGNRVWATFTFTLSVVYFLQCFDTVGWVVESASVPPGTEVLSWNKWTCCTFSALTLSIWRLEELPKKIE